MTDFAKTYTGGQMTDGQEVRVREIREKTRALADFLDHTCPPSRERSLALTNLEQAEHWAIVSIVKNE